jgi:hypothetical protein
VRAWQELRYYRSAEERCCEHGEQKTKCKMPETVVYEHGRNRESMSGVLRGAAIA